MLSLVVIGLLVLGVVGIVTAIGGRDDSGAVVAEQSQTPTPEAPVPDEKAASGKCPDELVAVSAKVNKKSFKEDAQPEFELVIANQHTATCLIEVGTKQQEFIVEKEGDVVWTSKYCAAEEDENAEVSTEFAPQSEKVAHFKWNRVRVDKNCNKTNKAFTAGSYDLTVKLGEKESKPVPFELEKDEATKAKEKKEAEEKKKAEEEKKAKEKKAEESAEPAEGEG